MRQLTGLRDAAPEIRARLFVLPGFAAAHRELAARHELVVASLDARRRSRRIVSEATWLPSRLGGVDVVHHGGGTVPLRSPGPVLLTLHDVQYRSYPEYLTPVKRRYLQLAIPRSVRPRRRRRRAQRVRAGHRHRRLRPRPDRVVVVPHGVDVPAIVTDADRAAASATASATGATSSTRRSPTRTRTTASCSTSWPDRGTTPTWPSSCSAAAASSRTTSWRRSGGSASGDGSCARDACPTPTATA